MWGRTSAISAYQSLASSQYRDEVSADRVLATLPQAEEINSTGNLCTRPCASTAGDIKSGREIPTIPEYSEPRMQASLDHGSAMYTTNSLDALKTSKTGILGKM